MCLPLAADFGSVPFAKVGDGADQGEALASAGLLYLEHRVAVVVGPEDHPEHLDGAGVGGGVGVEQGGGRAHPSKLARCEAAAASPRAAVSVTKSTDPVSQRWLHRAMDADAARLPHVDEHTVEVAADVEAIWETLLRVVEGTVSSGAAAPFARLLGCADTTASGPRPLALGSAVPGFHVAGCEPGVELDLAGGHRFSDYALIFRLEQMAPDRTRLRAETRAAFPGLRGSVYRALVIGTRMHVLATRRILSAVKRRAERAAPAV